MTKQEMVAQIAKESGVKKDDVTYVINLYKECLKAAIRTGEPLQVKGFGTFTKKTRSQRECRNPRTGETMTVPAKDYVAFKQSSGFKL